MDLVITTVIAVLGLVIATWTAYMQFRKVDELSIAFLSFGLARTTVERKHQYVELTFALANTGSRAAIVSGMYLVSSRGEGASGMERAFARGLSAWMEPLLVTAGNLVHGQVFFPVIVDEQTTRNEYGRIPLKLHVELIDGKGIYKAREIAGFQVGLQGDSMISGYPLGKSEVLLPKPASDKAMPLGM